jgi:uncharacterized protein DUF1207
MPQFVCLIRGGLACISPEGRRKKMKPKEAAKVLRVLAILLLCFPLPLRAGTTENFIQGYASAVLERELRIKNFSLNVDGETVRIESAGLAAADHDKVIAALLSIPGVRQVTIVDSRGGIVASSTPQEPKPRRTSGQEPVEPDYELGFLPGGNLFEPLIADPRWPHRKRSKLRSSGRELEQLKQAR